MVNSVKKPQNASHANFSIAFINNSFINKVRNSLTNGDCGVDKVLVAQTVANRLFATEDAIDTALMEASQLLQTMLQARQDLGLSAVVADKAPAQLSQAIAALTAARSAVVEVHGALEETKLRIGIRTKMIGYFKKVADFEGGVSSISTIDRIAG